MRAHTSRVFGRLAKCSVIVWCVACSPELSLFEPTDPRCDGTYCEQVGRTCGPLVDPCGNRSECGGCGEGSTCSALGRCERGDCPLAVGEVVELGRYPGFRTRPVAFATTPAHVYFWTAFPTLSTPGDSSVYRADKCGGALIELHERVGQDDVNSGYTLAVDDTHLYFANQRGLNLPLFRAPLPEGEREALTEPMSRFCGLVVDEPRDRIVFARCDAEAPGLYAVPRTGGAVTLLFEASPWRRVAREDDRLVWIDRAPPGIGQADLGRDVRVGLVSEPTTPRDVILHRGDVYWLRPQDDATELVTLTIDGPFVLARFGPEVRSLAAFEETIYVVDAESAWAVERTTGEARRLAGRGGEYVYADADGLYVSGTEAIGDRREHVIRRYGR